MTDDIFGMTDDIFGGSGSVEFHLSRDVFAIKFYATPELLADATALNTACSIVFDAAVKAKGGRDPLLVRKIAFGTRAYMLVGTGCFSNDGEPTGCLDGI